MKNFCVEIIWFDSLEKEQKVIRIGTIELCKKWRKMSKYIIDKYSQIHGVEK